MVYCGKPSKGCSNCRERKIRCDQREPACGQCEKRQAECPGYRNQVDLMFRDESSHVIKKAKAKARRRDPDAALGASHDQPLSASESDSASPEPNGSRGLCVLTRSACSPRDPESLLQLSAPPAVAHGPDWHRSPSVMYALNPTYQERGTAFFFSRFVAIDEKACHQRFDFIYDVWRPRTLSDAPHELGEVDSVMASMTAVGLAGLANMTRSGDVMDSARKSYGTALRLINTALRVPGEAVKDTTMLSILILGLFEMITDRDARTAGGTVKAWHEHVNGAAVLAKIRGVGQFRTRAGIKMFMMLCQVVILSCIQQGVPMPQSVLDLRAELSRRFRSLNAPESRIEVSMPIYRVLEFRHEVRSGNFDTPEAAIERLIKMDDDFEHVIANLPSSYRYRTLRLPFPHKDVFDGICHVYPNMGKAAIWNGFRSCRLLILETILTEIHSRYRYVDPACVPPRHAAAFAAARARLPKLCRAIVASVPQALGLLAGPIIPGAATPIATVEVRAPPLQARREQPAAPFPSASTVPASACRSADPAAVPVADIVLDDSGPTLLNPTRSRYPDEETHRLMLLASAGNNMVWPLYHVGMSSVCSSAMKTYCINRLQEIYKGSGLQQAKEIASIMQNRRVVPRWMELSFWQEPGEGREEVV
ncbi:hypothetical protein, variant [Magnaporthiopsis poae ATCC 64411]|uniref:Zn(2)-C6 fungal-type domain-containing protein n=1 Tax=Magnaporthiopsis poae (strain ATCC 64411 / 73-15) TaxID=644358 RepID=A0A0C4E690_MAGP6|nr:hypothetical protein, variant [Magnaporthiopsis poae ATCC 64411]